MAISLTEQLSHIDILKEIQYHGPVFDKDYYDSGDKSAGLHSGRRMFYDFYAMEMLWSVVGSGRYSPEERKKFAFGSGEDPKTYMTSKAWLPRWDVPVTDAQQNIVDDIYDQVVRETAKNLINYIHLAVVQEFQYLTSYSHAWTSFRNAIMSHYNQSKKITKSDFQKLVQQYIPALAPYPDTIKKLLKYSKYYEHESGNNAYDISRKSAGKQEPEKTEPEAPEVPEVPPKGYEGDYVSPPDLPPMPGSDIPDDTNYNKPEVHRRFGKYGEPADPNYKPDEDEDGGGEVKERLTEEMINTSKIKKVYKAMHKAGVTLDDIEKAYNYIDWSGAYGGPKWGEGAISMLKLYREKKVKDPSELAAIIDHIYDLQHNTGSLLNKGPMFIDETDLNRRFKITHIARFLPFVSPIIKRLIERFLSHFQNDPEAEKNKLKLIATPSKFLPQEQEKELINLGFKKLSNAAYRADIKFVNKKGEGVSGVYYELKWHTDGKFSIADGLHSDIQVFDTFADALKYAKGFEKEIIKPGQTWSGPEQVKSEKQLYIDSHTRVRLPPDFEQKLLDIEMGWRSKPSSKYYKMYFPGSKRLFLYAFDDGSFLVSYDNTNEFFIFTDFEKAYAKVVSMAAGNQMVYPDKEAAQAEINKLKGIAPAAPIEHKEWFLSPDRVAALNTFVHTALTGLGIGSFDIATQKDGMVSLSANGAKRFAIGKKMASTLGKPYKLEHYIGAENPTYHTESYYFKDWTESIKFIQINIYNLVSNVSIKAKPIPAAAPAHIPEPTAVTPQVMPSAALPPYATTKAAYTMHTGIEAAPKHSIRLTKEDEDKLIAIGFAPNSIGGSVWYIHKNAGDTVKFFPNNNAKLLFSTKSGFGGVGVPAISKSIPDMLAFLPTKYSADTKVSPIKAAPPSQASNVPAGGGLKVSATYEPTLNNAGFFYNAVTGLYMDGNNSIKINPGYHSILTIKDGPVKEFSSLPGLLQYIKHDYPAQKKTNAVTGNVPHFASNEQIANNLNKKLENSGIVVNGEIPPGNKINAIKSILADLAEFQPAGDKIKLTNAKYAVENYSLFLDYIKHNGVPDMTKSNTLPRKLNAWKQNKTQNESQNDLSQTEINDIEIMAALYPNVTVETITHYAKLNHAGKSVRIKIGDGKDKTLILIKQKGQYAGIRELSNNTIDTVLQTQDFNAVHDFIAQYLDAATGGTSNVHPNELTDEEVKYINEVVKNYPGVFTSEHSSFFAYQGRNIQITVSPGKHIRCLYNNGTFFISIVHPNNTIDNVAATAHWMVFLAELKNWLNAELGGGSNPTSGGTSPSIPPTAPGGPSSGKLTPALMDEKLKEIGFKLEGTVEAPKTGISYILEDNDGTAVFVRLYTDGTASFIDHQHAQDFHTIEELNTFIDSTFLNKTESYEKNNLTPQEIAIVKGLANKYNLKSFHADKYAGVEGKNVSIQIGAEFITILKSHGAYRVYFASTGQNHVAESTVWDDVFEYVENYLKGSAQANASRKKSNKLTRDEKEWIETYVRNNIKDVDFVEDVDGKFLVNKTIPGYPAVRMFVVYKTDNLSTGKTDYILQSYAPKTQQLAIFFSFPNFAELAAYIENNLDKITAAGKVPPNEKKSWTDGKTGDPKLDRMLKNAGFEYKGQKPGDVLSMTWKNSKGDHLVIYDDNSGSLTFPGMSQASIGFSSLDNLKDYLSTNIPALAKSTGNAVLDATLKKYGFKHTGDDTSKATNETYTRPDGAKVYIYDDGSTEFANENGVYEILGGHTTLDELKEFLDEKYGVQSSTESTGDPELDKTLAEKGFVYAGVTPNISPNKTWKKPETGEFIYIFNDGSSGFVDSGGVLHGIAKDSLELTVFLKTKYDDFDKDKFQKFSDELKKYKFVDKGIGKVGHHIWESPIGEKVDLDVKGKVIYKDNLGYQGTFNTPQDFLDHLAGSKPQLTTATEQEKLKGYGFKRIKHLPSGASQWKHSDGSKIVFKTDGNIQFYTPGKVFANVFSSFGSLIKFLTDAGYNKGDNALIKLLGKLGFKVGNNTDYWYYFPNGSTIDVTLRNNKDGTYTYISKHGIEFPMPDAGSAIMNLNLLFGTDLYKKWKEIVLSIYEKLLEYGFRPFTYNSGGGINWAHENGLSVNLYTNGTADYVSSKGEIISSFGSFDGLIIYLGGSALPYKKQPEKFTKSYYDDVAPHQDGYTIRLKKEDEEKMNKMGWEYVPTHVTHSPGGYVHKVSKHKVIFLNKSIPSNKEKPTAWLMDEKGDSLLKFEKEYPEDVVKYFESHPEWEPKQDPFTAAKGKPIPLPPKVEEDAKKAGFTKYDSSQDGTWYIHGQSDTVIKFFGTVFEWAISTGMKQIAMTAENAPKFLEVFKKIKPGMEAGQIDKLFTNQKPKSKKKLGTWEPSGENYKNSVNYGSAHKIILNLHDSAILAGCGFGFGSGDGNYTNQTTGDILKFYDNDVCEFYDEDQAENKEIGTIKDGIVFAVRKYIDTKTGKIKPQVPHKLDEVLNQLGFHTPHLVENSIQYLNIGTDETFYYNTDGSCLYVYEHPKGSGKYQKMKFDDAQGAVNYLTNLFQSNQGTGLQTDTTTQKLQELGFQYNGYVQDSKSYEYTKAISNTLSQKVSLIAPDMMHLYLFEGSNIISYIEFPSVSSGLNELEHEKDGKISMMLLEPLHSRMLNAGFEYEPTFYTYVYKHPNGDHENMRFFSDGKAVLSHMTKIGAGSYQGTKWTDFDSYNKAVNFSEDLFSKSKLPQTIASIMGKYGFKFTGTKSNQIDVKGIFDTYETADGNHVAYYAQNTGQVIYNKKVPNPTGHAVPYFWQTKDFPDVKEFDKFMEEESKTSSSFSTGQKSNVDKFMEKYGLTKKENLDAGFGHTAPKYSSPDNKHVVIIQSDGKMKYHTFTNGQWHSLEFSNFSELESQFNLEKGQSKQTPPESKPKLELHFSGFDYVDWAKKNNVGPMVGIKLVPKDNAIMAGLGFMPDLGPQNYIYEKKDKSGEHILFSASGKSEWFGVNDHKFFNSIKEAMQFIWNRKYGIKESFFKQLMSSFLY